MKRLTLHIPEYRNDRDRFQSSFRIILLQLCSPLLRLCYWLLASIQTWRYKLSVPFTTWSLIMTTINRQYRQNTTGEIRVKEGNGYFHLNVHSVRRKQPYFSPQTTTLPYLTKAHLQYLREFGLSLPF